MTSGKDKDMKQVKPEDLKLDAGCQARISLTEEALEAYAAAYKAGESLPPVEAFEVDGELLIVDGWHRVEAAKRAKVETFPVKVVGEGSLEDAVWEALGKNQIHGVRRSNADKRKSVRLALATDKGAAMSDRKLAKHLGVSHAYVGKLRGGKAADEQFSDEQLAQTVKLGHAFLATRDGADLVARVRTEDLGCQALGDAAGSEGNEALNAKSSMFLIWRRFEQARQKMEAQGGYFWAGVDLLYVAAMVLEAAGYPEHRAKFGKEGKKPIGRALRIPDSYPDDVVEELQQLALWRKVERFKAKPVAAKEATTTEAIAN